MLLKTQSNIYHTRYSLCQRGSGWLQVLTLLLKWRNEGQRYHDKKKIKMCTVSVIDFESASASTSTAIAAGGAALELPEAIEAGGNVCTELESPRLACFMARETLR